MNQRKVSPGELPPGVADLFFEPAERKLALEGALRDLFARWGFRPVIPPTFEYADTLAAEVGMRMAEEMYRFFDRDGRALALRPDLTIPTARIAGVKLYDQPLPLRFFYVGNVFRYEEPRAGQQREFTQAGVELIGAPGPAADAEVIALLVDALRQAGLEDFRVTLGQIAFVRGALEGFSLSDGDLAQLHAAIDRKSEEGLAAVLSRLEGDPRAARALSALSSLVGGEEVLAEAEAFAWNEGMRGALAHLREVWRRLEQFGVASHVVIDLGQVRGMAYYTGVLFEAFAPGIGFPIASGGRYDRLIARFGADLPAVGCAIVVDRLLAAQDHQRVLPVVGRVDAIFQMCEHAECMRLAQLARSWGARVLTDVMGRSPADLLAYAAEQQIPRVVLCKGPGRCHLVEAGVERSISAADWEGVVRSWTR